jgi:hypothetical protein
MPNAGRNFDNLITAMIGDVEDSALPLIFRKWGAISAIAGAMGKTCWYRIMNKTGDGEVFRFTPAMYVILVSRPGVGKSASLDIPYGRVFGHLSEEIGSKMDDWGKRWKNYGMLRPLWCHDARVSAEKVALDMKQTQTVVPELSFIDEKPYVETSMSLITSEFGCLMERFDKTIQLFLTEAWDGKDYKYRMKHSAPLVIRNPNLNWIACSTFDELVTYLPPSSRGQGLLSRIILVSHPGEPPEDDLEYASPSDASVSLMIEDMAEVAKLQGEFLFESDETYQKARDWIKTRGNGTAPKDPKLQEYNNRRKVHVMKVAMVVSAAKRSTRVITEEDWNDAIEILIEAEETMPRALQHFGTSDTGKIAMEIAEIVKNRGFMKVPEFTKILLERVRTPAECQTLYMAMNDAHLIQVIGSKVFPGDHEETAQS